MPPILIDAKELGEKLGRTPQTILGWARRGDIPCLKGGSGRVLFDLDQVMEALHARGQRKKADATA